MAGLSIQLTQHLADEIVHKRVHSQSPYPYLTYCTNCRDTFSTDNKESWHILRPTFSLHDLNNRGLKEKRSEHF